MQKEIFSAVAIALTFIAFLPYIRSILRDEFDPAITITGGKAKQDIRAQYYQSRNVCTRSVMYAKNGL